MFYAIELIRIDHPGLWTGNFQVCAVARCRKYGDQPWRLDVACEDLCNADQADFRFGLTWDSSTKQESFKAERTYQANRLTEDAAIGVCGAVFAGLAEGRITEVTQYGDGVDYWIDDRRAILEVSGIQTGESGDLQRRHREKIRQLKASHLFLMGKPGYVFVVLFSQRTARFSFHRH